VADRHSVVLISIGGVVVVAGAALISIGVSEVGNTARALSSNGWFDLGVAVVIAGVALAVIGGVLHFRREVEGRPAGPAAVNRALWEALCHPAGPDRVAFELCHRFGDQHTFRDFNLLRCIVTNPDEIPAESDGTSRIRQYPPDFPAAPRVRPGRYRSEWKGRISDGRWVDITSATHEVPAEDGDGAADG